MKVHIGPYIDWIGPYQLADYFKHLNIFIQIPQAVFNGVIWLFAPFLSPTLAPLLISVNEWFDSKKFDDYRDDRLHKLGEFFAHGFTKQTEEQKKLFADDRPKTWLYKLCEWIYDKRTRKVKIKLDPWDTWNMETTLAMLALPLLKQLKEHKHGSGYIDLEDVPKELRYTETEDYDSQLTFDFYKEEAQKKQCDVHARYEWFLNELIWTFEQLQPDCDWEEQYSSGEIEFYFEKCEDNPSLSRMIRGPNDTYEVDWKGREEHQARINNGLRLFGKYFQTLWD